jgi:hypothetical protein
MDLMIDVFYQGKPLEPGRYYNVDEGDDFVVFLDDEWRGRHVSVQEINKDRVTVLVGDDLRAPIPWRSVEAALTAGGR